jgi:hypothetical protein
VVCYQVYNIPLHAILIYYLCNHCFIIDLGTSQIVGVDKILKVLKEYVQKKQLMSFEGPISLKHCTDWDVAHINTRADR